MAVCVLAAWAPGTIASAASGLQPTGRAASASATSRPASTAATALSAGATERVLAAGMRSSGPSAGAYVLDLDGGAQIYSRAADTRRIPASVEKLYVSSAALRKMGPTGRLVTGVFAQSAPDASGVVDGDLYLRGGGDPTFDALASGRLAQQVSDAGITEITGQVIGDESAFDTRRGVPSSRFALSSDVGGPLSALVYERGRTGRRAPFWQPRPANFAAGAFARQLRDLDIDVTTTVARGRAPSNAALVTEWRSRPLPELLTLMNGPSDNFIAEILIKALGAQYGEGGSTAAGARVLRAALGELQIEPQIVDGSGLSRRDRTSPREVVTMLQAHASDDAFVRSLPVAGRSGTIAGRMRGTAAHGRCRAKTGTLRDVSTLAGYCNTVGGRRVAFAFMMNYTSPGRARPIQDRMTAALARYGDY